MRRARFRVLGPVQAFWDSGEVVVNGGRVAAVLAGLLLSANRPASLTSITRWLWEADATPVHSRAMVHNLISRLRRHLGPDRILTMPWGYQLNARADELDLLRFRELAAAAQQAAAHGRDEQALATLDAAIALWQESLWHNVSAPGLREQAVAYLTEKYLDAAQQRADLCLRLGRLDGLSAELSELAAAHPFREAFTGQLMTVLARAGRQAEALASYDRLRRVLATDLGIDPSPAVHDLYLGILRSNDISYHDSRSRLGMS